MDMDMDKKHAISNLSGLGVCSTMDQFDKFEAISAKIVRGDKKFIKDFTGCLFPCTYLEYNVVEEQLLRGRHGLGIYYGSVAVTVKTEVSKLITLPRLFVKTLSHDCKHLSYTRLSTMTSSHWFLTSEAPSASLWDSPSLLFGRFSRILQLFWDSLSNRSGWVYF